MNAHILQCTSGLYPASCVTFCDETYTTANVRDHDNPLLLHRTNTALVSCTCRTPQRDDEACPHLVATCMAAGTSPWAMVPARYRLAEWREPYDKIHQEGGFQDVTDDEVRSLPQARTEDGELRFRAPVIMPNRRGRQRRIRSAEEQAIAAARGGGGGRARGGRRGRSGGRGRG